MMNTEKLEKNIIEMLKEEQIKLGYCSEPVRLYYPLESLNRLLDSNLDPAGMQDALAVFAADERARLGELTVSHKGDRFCLVIPPEGSDYVHSLIGEDEFLVRFVEKMRNHPASIQEILGVFRMYSDHVRFEKAEGKDFDYLICFEDGDPDDFYYCITDEGEHLIYHRFTKGDFEDLYPAQE